MHIFCFRIFYRHVIQLSELSVCWFGKKRAGILVYGSEWQARTSAELSAQRGAKRPRVRQGWATALPPPTHPFQPGLRPDRAPGGLAALPRQTLAEPTLIVPGAMLGAVSQDRR